MPPGITLFFLAPRVATSRGINLELDLDYTGLTSRFSLFLLGHDELYKGRVEVHTKQHSLVCGSIDGSLQSSISSALILGSQQEENPQQAQAINKYEILGVKVTKGASMKDERFENVPSQVSKK